MFGSPAASFQEQLFRDLQKYKYAKDKDVIYVIFGRKGDDPGLLDWLKNFNFNTEDIFRNKLRKDTPFDRLANRENDHDYVMGYVFTASADKEEDLDPEFTWAAFSGFTVKKFYMNDLQEIDIKSLRQPA